MPLSSSRHLLPAQGVQLQLHQSGAPGSPRVLLLHGFPEAAFIWQPLMTALAGEAHVLAPDQRGYGASDAPGSVAAYRARTLVADIAELIETTGGPVDLLVAHDWGGAVAWNLAAACPQLLRRLLIINSPHPALFLQALRDDPAQQAASAYMNMLCEADAAARLSADDFTPMWQFFEAMSPAASGDDGWLTPAMRAQYRAVWARGLDPQLNWYRASPLRPPLSAGDAIHQLSLPASMTHVPVPLRVLWGEADRALPPSLLNGLAEHVPDLRVTRVPDASHWLIHEQPALVLAAVREELAALRAGR